MRVPSVPRLPFVGDPLRRVRVPRELGPITSRGAEADPREVGMSMAGVERIWRSALDLYRSGVHPAVQVCVRRRGAVVLDRAVGHARGNGPNDPVDGAKVRATPGTPF